MENHSNRFGLNKVFLCLVISLMVVFAVVNSRAQGAGKVIVIDPGHGTTANSREFEGKPEMALALRLSTVLKQAGYQVVLTRSTTGGSILGAKNEDEDNVNRAKISNDAKADLVIRLHSDDHSRDEFAAIFPDKQGKDRTNYFGPADKNVLTLSQKFASSVTQAMKAGGLSGKNYGESTYSASEKGTLLIFSTHTTAPVVTLELYGHNSAELRKKYAQSATQDKVAQALGKSVDDYFGTSNEPTAQSDSTTSNPPANADDRCPPKPPAAGPSEGQDYQHQVAANFEEQMSLANPTEYDTSNPAAGIDAASSNIIAETARQEVGYQGNGDCTKYDGCAQWCGYFVTWVYNKAGFKMPEMAQARGILDWFKKTHHAFTDPSQAQAGDIVVWKRLVDYQGHIGIVFSNDVNGQKMVVIEGNTTNNKVKSYIYTYNAIIKKQGGLVGFGRW